MAQMVKNLLANARDPNSIPELRISTGEGTVQCSCLEHSMNRGAWWAIDMGSQRVGHN